MPPFRRHPGFKMIMDICLRKATDADCEMILHIQVKAFTPLLLKYQDYESSPAAEDMDAIQRRMAQSYTDYYLIEAEQSVLGMLRVCNFGVSCRLSPICILPEYQGHGHAQKAMTAMEAQYPNTRKWELDTIAQEEKLCHLYEKVGYRKTGRTDHLKDGMDLVFYEKIMN